MGNLCVRVLLVCLVASVGCGSVTGAVAKDAAGDDGAAGGAPAAGAGGGSSGGAGGASSGGSSGAAGTTGAAGAPADAGTDARTCVSTNAAGFAWNPPCGDAGALASCRASCELDGKPFVGCVAGSTIGTECRASCADCPR